MMTIGNRIAGLRKAKGFTQEYIAEHLGVSRQAVSKWEQDQTAPDTKNLIALSDLLGASIEYIATGKSSPSSETMDSNWLSVRRINRKIDSGNRFLITGVTMLLVSLPLMLIPLLGIMNILIGIILIIVGIVKLFSASSMSQELKELEEFKKNSKEHK